MNTSAIFMSASTVCLNSIKPTLPIQGKHISAEQHVQKPVDRYSKTASPKENIKKSLKEGSLTYTPQNKLLGYTIRKAHYTYIANGRESVSDIRAKFGLKKGALRKTNSYIVDAEWRPEKGRLIYFNEEDIKSK